MASAPLAMTLDQIQTLVERLKDEPMGAAYVVAISTGLRESELLGLRWKDVSPDHLMVRGRLDEVTRTYGETKTKRPRPVDIPREVADLLQRHASTTRRNRPDDYVFQN